jgi:hypothetical protein
MTGPFIDSISLVMLKQGMQHDDELAMSGAKQTQDPHVCKSRALSGLQAAWPFSYHRHASSSSMLGSLGDGPDRLGMSRKLAGIQSGCCRINVQRQRKHENTSLPGAALYLKMAPMSLHKFPCEREPQLHA